MTALRDHRTDQSRSGGALLGSGGSDQSHSRIAASKHAGKVSLSLRGVSALSGNNWAELLYLRPLFIRMRRSSSPALRVVTLLPATRTYSQRGWGCSPARLAEFRARLAAGLRQEQVDALLSDPVDHVPCRDTDLPERHNQKSLFAVGRSVTINSEVNDGAVLYFRGNLPDLQGAYQHEFG